MEISLFSAGPAPQSLTSSRDGLCDSATLLLLVGILPVLHTSFRHRLTSTAAAHLTDPKPPLEP